MKLREWFDSGSPWVWLTAGAVSVSLFLVLGVLLLIAIRGLGYFWPTNVIEGFYEKDPNNIVRVIGEIADEEEVPILRIKNAGEQINVNTPFVSRFLIKLGNRDILGSDFQWFLVPKISKVHYPKELMVVERREWGNLYGYIGSVKENGQVIASGEAAWPEFQKRIDRVLEIFSRIRKIEKSEIGSINFKLEKLRLKERGLELENKLTSEAQAQISKEKNSFKEKYNGLEQELARLYKDINRDSYSVEVSDGRLVDLPLAKVVRAFQPNSMGLFAKIRHYFIKLWEFVSDEPREANTEGGIFPTIFGTVLMVLIMSIMVTPLGVIAAVYLREYARQGLLTRLIRIAVNNLAGVPSIVYGLFGLGFFVYFLGGNIDRLFFPEALPAPTFGTGGVMWASLTLAILTLPVVIVATEEGLGRIPSSIREGSLALGATKAETLWRTVLPMASPAIMTGLILAVARAAGEVAPLMLVGVVKLAPSLPLDENFPFLHLDRKFMHLGFHIYDVGFQSPNVEAARPLVYATALLLVLVIVALNLTAIFIRNHLREKYRNLES